MGKDSDETLIEVMRLLYSVVDSYDDAASFDILTADLEASVDRARAALTAYRKHMESEQ